VGVAFWAAGFAEHNRKTQHCGSRAVGGPEVLWKLQSRAGHFGYLKLELRVFHVRDGVLPSAQTCFRSAWFCTALSGF
jgi:hypothetical protein